MRRSRGTAGWASACLDGLTGLCLLFLKEDDGHLEVFCELLGLVMGFTTVSEVVTILRLHSH